MSLDILVALTNIFWDILILSTVVTVVNILLADFLINLLNLDEKWPS